MKIILKMLYNFPNHQVVSKYCVHIDLQVYPGPTTFRPLRAFISSRFRLFNGGHLGYGDDLHFTKNEQASPTVYYHKVWPISAKRSTKRRHLKSLVKYRPSAAILYDVII